MSVAAAVVSVAAAVAVAAARVVHGYMDTFGYLYLPLYVQYGYQCNSLNCTFKVCAIHALLLYCTYFVSRNSLYVQYMHFCCIAVPDTDTVHAPSALERLARTSHLPGHKSESRLK